MQNSNPSFHVKSHFLQTKRAQKARGALPDPIIPSHEIETINTDSQNCPAGVFETDAFGCQTAR
jgi:hypothetical protein